MNNNYRSGVNTNTYNLFFDAPKLSSETINHEVRKIFYTIDVNNLSNIFSKMAAVVLYRINTGIKIELNKIKKQKDKNDKPYYVYDLDNGENIKFRKLSDFIECDSKKNLLSSRRYGDCHGKSLMISKWTKNSKLLSGKCRLSYDFHHSVVLFENGDIADWTRNLIIRKEDYEKLTKFRLIQSIDSKDLIELVDLYKILPELDLRMYLYFRDELVKDLEKHKILKKK